MQELQTNNRTDTAGGTSSTKNSSFGYDDEIRLTQAQTDTGGLFGTDTENFTLDAVGNRIAHTPVSGAWTYDANNRLTQRGTGATATAYEYDQAGNLTTKTEPGNKVTRYGYDSQNRLVEVKDGSNNLIARYGYDPMDRRLWKEQYRDGQDNALATPKRTLYLYSDEGLIAEATQDIMLNAADNSVSATAAPQITTQYGPQPDANFITGTLFVKTKNSNGQDVVAYYQRDQLDTPIQATDKAGNIVWAASYNAFGQATITTPAATTANPTITSNLRLPGQYWDDETGLHYNWHRYYDPQTGRYVSSDPIGLAGGVNTYAYTNNSPLNYSDPTGRCPWCVGAGIGAAIGAVSGAVQAANAGGGWTSQNAWNITVGALTGGLTGAAAGAIPSQWGILAGMAGGALAGGVGNAASQWAGGTSLKCIDWRQAGVQALLGGASGGLGLAAGYGSALNIARAGGTGAGAVAFGSIFGGLAGGAAQIWGNLPIPTNLGGFLPTSQSAPQCGCQ
ncbi:MAG TPA: RHS repeat-associated core domain-containing protein [Rhodocyclaceae bacterium]|nr:RHS repeat-associated core domain-containing protein [Rhodocyclaceae bacterium]